MNWPSVGVVIPTRNRPELVRKAIAAVRDQHYPGEVKVVVVYDQTEPDYLLASTDGTQVLVLTNWRTSGLAGARNTGILALDTEFVAFCDDDDQWRPDKLRRQVAALLAEPDAEFATCAIEVEYEGRTTPRLAGHSRVTDRRAGPLPDGDAALVVVPDPPGGAGRGRRSAWSPRTRRAARTRTGTCCCGPPAGRRSCTSTSRWSGCSGAAPRTTRTSTPPRSPRCAG